MSKILILSPWAPPPDGIADHSSSLASTWTALGHKVLVIAPGTTSPTKLSVDDAFTQPITTTRSLSLLRLKENLAVIRHFQPDMIYLAFAIPALGPSLFAALAVCRALKYSTPSILACHEASREIDLPLLGPLVYSLAKRATTHAVAFSDPALASLTSHGFSPALLPLGLTIPAPASPSDLQTLAKKYNVTKPLILESGFILPAKGAAILVEAARILKETRPDLDFQVLIAGSPRPRTGIFKPFGEKDVAHAKLLADTVKREKLSSVVSFTPHMSSHDFQTMFQLATINALPYLDITQSSIASHALAAGSTIVASDIPGLRADLGPAARFVTPNNAQSLARVLAELLASPRERNALAAAARSRALDATFTQVAKDLLALTREVSP